MKTSFAPVALVAALLAGTAFPTLAQTLPPAMPPASTAVVPAKPAPLQPAIWHLPSSAARMRVTGEAGTLSWPIYLPAATAAPKSFQIGYQASVTVMPEASWITLTINGQAVSRIPVASPSGVKTMTIDIPPGLLQPGWNAVALDVVQRHRVDCSLASTYELWTQIDPEQTGFVGRPPAVATIADVGALPVDETGATRLHLLLPRDATPTDLGRAVRAAERVALRGHFSHPVVDTVPSASGLHIAVGMPAMLGTLPGVGGRVTSAALQVGTMPNGAPLLVVAGLGDSDLDRAIEAIGDTATEPLGTEEGLKALARENGLRLRPGGSLTLADLGVPTRTFSGRLLRAAFDVILPPDAYPADYAEARLSLDGGYAAGLAYGSRLVVRVNGVIDGNLDFNRTGGAVLHGQVIHMPLDAFRPGRNRIELEAQVSAKLDEACDTLTSIGAKERFLLLGTSTLSLPPLARVAQFPSLSATMAGNLRVTPNVPARVFLPRQTPGAIAAAATLLANAALSTGVPTGAVFDHGLPQSGTEPAIVVGNPSEVPAQILTAVGFDTQALSTAWRAGIRPGATPTRTEAVRFDAGGSDAARLNAWGDRVEAPHAWLGGSESIIGTVGGRFMRSLRSAGLLGYPDETINVTGDTNFALAQGLLDDTPLTVVTARDDASLASGMASLTEPLRLASLSGRAASLDDGAVGANLVPAHDTAFFRTENFSLFNDRLIAAGWVSQHAGYYLVAVLLSTVALGVSTWAFLIFGRKGHA